MLPWTRKSYGISWSRSSISIPIFHLRTSAISSNCWNSGQEPGRELASFRIYSDFMIDFIIISLASRPRFYFYHPEGWACFSYGVAWIFNYRTLIIGQILKEKRLLRDIESKVFTDLSWSPYRRDRPLNYQITRGFLYTRGTIVWKGYFIMVSLRHRRCVHLFHFIPWSTIRNCWLARLIPRCRVCHARCDYEKSLDQSRKDWFCWSSFFQIDRLYCISHRIIDPMESLADVRVYWPNWIHQIDAFFSIPFLMKSPCSFCEIALYLRSHMKTRVSRYSKQIVH